MLWSPFCAWIKQTSTRPLTSSKLQTFFFQPQPCIQIRRLGKGPSACGQNWERPLQSSFSLCFDLAFSSKVFQRFFYEFRNISSKIFSGSIRVFFLEFGSKQS
jgi:hypothetical protein